MTFHVNAYALNRAFGWSEEGGRWYGTWSTRAATVAARNALRPVIAAARRGPPLAGLAALHRLVGRAR